MKSTSNRMRCKPLDKVEFLPEMLRLMQVLKEAVGTLNASVFNDKTQSEVNAIMNTINKASENYNYEFRRILYSGFLQSTNPVYEAVKVGFIRQVRAAVNIVNVCDYQCMKADIQINDKIIDLTDFGLYVLEMTGKTVLPEGWEHDVDELRQEATLLQLKLLISDENKEKLKFLLERVKMRFHLGSAAQVEALAKKYSLRCEMEHLQEIVDKVIPDKGLRVTKRHVRWINSRTIRWLNRCTIDHGKSVYSSSLISATSMKFLVTEVMIACANNRDLDDEIS